MTAIATATTCIGVDTAPTLRSTHSARLYELAMTSIRAPLYWRISDLCRGNMPILGLYPFPAVVARIFRHTRSGVAAFQCGSRLIRRANRCSIDRPQGIEQVP